MTKGTKIFLGVGCGVLLIGAIVVVVGGIFALNYVEKSMGEAYAGVEAEGREFGKTVDQRGCIDEGIRRSRSMGPLDLSRAIALSTYVDACLETCRPTAGFCDGLPSFWSMKDAEWSAAQCRKAGVDPEKTGCIHVLKRQYQFCIKPF